MGNEIYLPQQWEDFWERRIRDLDTVFVYILKKPHWERVTLDDIYLSVSVYQQSIESWMEYHGVSIVWNKVAPDLHAIRNLQVHLKKKSVERRFFTCDSLIAEVKRIQYFSKENNLEIHGLRSFSEALIEILNRYKNDD